MNEPTQKDVIADLVRVAGRRPEPPEELRARVFADASEALSEKLGRRRRQGFGLAAMAAAMVVMLGGAFLARMPAPAPFSASVVRVVGTVERVSVAGTSPVTLTAALASGDVLRTQRDGQAALRVGGVDVRLDRASSVKLVDSRQLELIRGRVFIDAGDTFEDQFLVQTALGEVTDIGTRFEVSFVESQLRVRVQDGEVELAGQATRARVQAGQQWLQQAGDAGAVAQIATHDDSWRWALELATAPRIDGQPLAVLLEWAARESGYSVEIRDAEAERKTRETLLYDEIEPSLLPLDALALRLDTTDLNYNIAEGVIRLWTNSP